MDDIKKLYSFKEESKKRQKSWFIWKLDFFDVFKSNNGFDIVIGNPPYVQIKEIDENIKNIYRKKYTYATGRFNLFYLFLELGSLISKPNGIINYIIPDRILLNTQCSEIRDKLLKQTNY